MEAEELKRGRIRDATRLGGKVLVVTDRRQTQESKGKVLVVTDRRQTQERVLR